ncbi:hypothetical protein ACEQ8H_007594 [Pleosporales sp. CAS-2024a]
MSETISDQTISDQTISDQTMFDQAVFDQAMSETMSDQTVFPQAMFEQLMLDQTGTIFDQIGTMFDQTGTIFDQTGTILDQTGNMFDQTVNMFDQTMGETSESDRAGQSIMALELFQSLSESPFACGGSLMVSSSRWESPSTTDNPVADSSSSQPSSKRGVSMDTIDTIVIRWDSSLSIETVVFPIPLSDVMDEVSPLQKLVDGTQCNTFGRKVYDADNKSYRTPFKLDANWVSSNFCPYECGIIDVISQTLLPKLPSSSQGIRAKLTRLNVYQAPSGDSSAHVDTPQSELHFGTLVVCLPCDHEGGQLVVCHQEKSTMFDWSGAGNELKWAAFYIDCEHKVRTVTSGHRITLTYNLYMRRGLGELAGFSPVLDPRQLPVYRYVKEALANPCFMAQGGFLGRYCTHAYAHTTSNTQYTMPSILKGSDMVAYEVFRALGMTTHARPVYVPITGRPLVSEDVADGGRQFLTHSQIGDNFSEVVECSGKLGNDDNVNWTCVKSSHELRDVVWMNWPRQGNEAVQFAYAAYGWQHGNQCETVFTYSFCALIFEIPPYGERIKPDRSMQKSRWAPKAADAASTASLDPAMDPDPFAQTASTDHLFFDDDVIPVAEPVVEQSPLAPALVDVDAAQLPDDAPPPRAPPIPHAPQEPTAAPESAHACATPPVPTEPKEKPPHSVRGDRTLTGGPARTRLTNAQLDAKLESMRSKNEALLTAHARAEADLANFEAREAVLKRKDVERKKLLAEKQRAERQNRQQMMGEREKNKQRKLNAQGGREWDLSKVDGFSGTGEEKRRGAPSGVHGAIAPSRHTHNAVSAEPAVQEEAASQNHHARGRGRGGRRGRGGGRGARDDHDGARDATQPKRAAQAPPPSAADFPELPLSTAHKNGNRTTPKTLHLPAKKKATTTDDAVAKSPPAQHTKQAPDKDKDKRPALTTHNSFGLPSPMEQGRSWADDV